jgi:hypothetical protein
MFFEKAAGDRQSRFIPGESGETTAAQHPPTYIFGVKAPICLTRIDI